MTGYVLARVEAAGLVSVSPAEPARRGPLVTIRAHDAAAVVAALAAEKVVISEREGNLRVAPDF